MKKKLYGGFFDFCEKPIGDIEGDVCDWNSPRHFVDSISPSDLEKRVKQRVDAVSGELKDFLRQSLLSYQDKVIESLPKEKHPEIFDIPEGEDIGTYRFCEELRREGYNQALSDIKQAIKNIK